MSGKPMRVRQTTDRRYPAFFFHQTRGPTSPTGPTYRANAPADFTPDFAIALEPKAWA